MSLAPLLDAAPAIPLHAFAAMAAFVLGLVQFAAPKGTLPHRTIGWIWVSLMAAVAISSFWIHQIRLVGPWSPIHLLSIFTLVMLPLAVWRAHTAPGRRPSPHHDLDFLGALVDRRACSRCCRGGSCTRSCSALSAPSERRPGGGISAPKRAFARALPEAVSRLAKRRPLSRVSLWKNEGKNRSRRAV